MTPTTPQDAVELAKRIESTPSKLLLNNYSGRGEEEVRQLARAIVERGLRTPGTVEVCEHYTNHDCQMHHHYGDPNNLHPVVCDMFALCPLREVSP